MKTLLYGLAALPFIATVALADPATPQPQAPVQLSENQMDQVTAGWRFLETTTSNTSITVVSVYNTPNTITCDACYLLINNNALSVASLMKGGL
jgi:hypothetical protein